MAKKSDAGSSRGKRKGGAGARSASKQKSAGRKKAARPTRTTRPGLAELIGQALTDAEFRDQLFTNRETVVRRFQLSRADKAALARLTRDQIEEQAGRLGGRAAITIKVVISKSF